MSFDGVSLNPAGQQSLNMPSTDSCNELYQLYRAFQEEETELEPLQHALSQAPNDSRHSSAAGVSIDILFNRPSRFTLSASLTDSSSQFPQKQCSQLSPAAGLLVPATPSNSNSSLLSTGLAHGTTVDTTLAVPVAAAAAASAAAFWPPQTAAVMTAQPVMQTAFTSHVPGMAITVPNPVQAFRHLQTANMMSGQWIFGPNLPASALPATWPAPTATTVVGPTLQPSAFAAAAAVSPAAPSTSSISTAVAPKTPRRRKTATTGVRSRWRRRLQAPTTPSPSHSHAASGTPLATEIEKLPGRCPRRNPRSIAGKDAQFGPAHFKRVIFAVLRQLLPKSEAIVQLLLDEDPMLLKKGVDRKNFDKYLKQMFGNNTMSPEELRNSGRPVEGAALWWPSAQEFELQKAGVVHYLARFMSHAAGFEITPKELRACFEGNAPNQYEVNWDQVQQLGINPKNWEMPLTMHEMICQRDNQQHHN